MTAAAPVYTIEGESVKVNTQEWLDSTLSMEEITLPSGPYILQHVRPRLRCADGMTVSVQAGKYLYCVPRMDAAKHYSEVEVGFPSERPPAHWLEWADAGEGEEANVWGYVPIEEVDAWLVAHGGIVGKAEAESDD